MRDPLDPQVMVLAPCKGATVAQDGTITIEGIFNQLTVDGPGTRLSLDFSVVALLTSSVGSSTANLQLVSPDGLEAWRGTSVLDFQSLHSLVGTAWRVQAVVPAGDYELRLSFDDGVVAATLPFLLTLQPT